VDKFEPLRRSLIEHFGDEKHITTLENLTKKITTISKVRVGKEEHRTVINYAEISLRNINNLGYITIPDDYKGHPPANEISIKKQALHYHDIILPFRNSYYNSIGLIQKSYEKYPIVVGNNGMIRIEFEDDRKEDTPIYIYNYLKLRIIENFINSLCAPKKVNNPLVSSGQYYLETQILKSLPIPIFYEGNGAYKEYIHSRLRILDTFDSIQVNISFLRDSLETLEIKGGESDFSKLVTFSSQAEKTYCIAEAIREFEKKLSSIMELDTFRKYKQKQIF